MNFMNPGYSFFNRFPRSTFASGKQKNISPGTPGRTKNE